MKYKKIVLAILSIVLSSNIFAQNLNWDWVQLWNARIKSIDVDNNNNVFVLCHVRDTLNFPDTNLIGDYYKGYLIKIDSSKNFIWATEIDTLNKYSKGNLKINNDEIIVSYHISNLAVLEKYDLNGNLILRKKMPMGIQINNFIIDGDNNINITGGVFMNSTFEDTTLIVMGYSDMYLLKYNQNFDLLWINQGGSYSGYKKGGRIEEGTALICDNNNDIYVGGIFCDTAYFNNMQVIGGQSNFMNSFIAKYSKDGQIKWIKTILADQAYINDICIDLQQNIYLAGSVCGYQSIIISDTSDLNFYCDSYVAKLDSGGNLIWNRNLGYQNGRNDEASSIAIMNNNNLYINGYFNEQFYCLTDTFTCPYTMLYIVKMEINGNVKWAESAANSNMPVNYFTKLIQKQNNLYLIGTLLDSAFFGNTFVSNSGFNDFIAKIFDPTNSNNEVEIINTFIFPNPFTDNLKVIANVSETITIFNIIGQLILIADINPGINEINTSTFKQGTYLVKFNTSNLVFKIMKF
jgi:hypothetical protein